MTATAGRPATAPAELADPTTEVRLWDNANIVESYPGLTTPLTYSVARAAYADVYRQLCRTVGVSEPALAAHAPVFEQMIGLIQGRVYYNVTSWHVVLALLPGFRHSRALLERMMGAAGPGQGVAPVRSQGGLARALEMAGIGLRLTWFLITFGRTAGRFERVIADLRRETAVVDLEQLSADALLTLFERTSRRAIANWRAPLLNDLFVMVFHGTLRRLAERWLGPDADALVAALLRDGALPSVAPATGLRALAAAARAEPAWRAALTEDDPADLAGRLTTDPALAGLHGRLDDYLARWGDRCPEELKLDRATYRDDPAPLLAALAALVTAPATAPVAPDRAAAAAEARRRLAAAGWWCGPARRAVFALVLARARYHVRWREQLRFARGQVFGLGRPIVTVLGRALVAAGALADPADVHYLELAEIAAAVRGTGAVAPLPPLVARRRAEYRAFAVGPLLPNRFRTRGPVVLGQIEAAPVAAPAGGPLTGAGASPGRVTAPCQVVRDPRQAGDVAGRIIVAEATDPGWVALLAAAAGLVVERGGLLSHSAIVARELGLPTIVGVAGATATFHSGQWLTIDGATGRIEVHDGPPAAAGSVRR
ncbi:MAG: hypothetical protein IT340_13390 [Chloroflexi bacterium]|nr:hypothetical protein [Chloroflexota bacterium]